ncbi:LuxR C-terminal-related transcriptional regulator [Lysinibacillus sp. FSL K6-0232]|uniref:LuxR C-terminal-related transcriptional regulator n=1 Tax=Lysinibacillus sp. FSL K6-0232 TaxID=2921425 RepID=UPI0030FCEEFC
MIIATKLHIPQSRSELVVRSRLIHRLHEGLERTLTLITAPAGYGKTTLLGEWVMTLENPVAWVSLDQGDNDRTRFWAHTIAALKQAYPSFDQQDVLRHVAEDPSGVSLIAALINGLHRISHTMVLVWDDFHHIEETSILQGVTYLLERLPLHVHLYLASRNSPALPLSRLRAENRLISLEASDLRFVPDETTEFFAKCGGIQLSNEDVATVQKKTEGWAVAMRLAVLSMHEHTDPVSLIRKMAGTERDISDYFFDEVLARQSATMQQFLLYTSILDRMKGELCQAVTGIAESHAYLQQLDKESLFLVALDEWREWYRYHHLFRQFLTAQLKMREPRQWQTLHMTAGKWLEEKGYPHEAVDHYLAAADYEHALSLIEEMTPELMTNEWTTLCKWLNAIPDTLLFARPMMLLIKLASQYMSGHVEAATDGYWQAVRWLEEDTASLHPFEAETLQAGLAFLAAFRTFLDRDFEYAVQFSKEYVEKHPEGDFFIEFGSDEDGYHPVWDIYVSDDSLRLAEQVLTSLLSIWSETRNVYFVAHLYIDLGKMQYERNRLVEAEKLMRQAYDIGRLHDNRSLATIAALWLARIAAVQGDEATSNQILQELTQQTSKMANPHLSGKIALFRAMQGWMRGEEKPVKRWLKKSGLRFHDEIPVSMIKEYDLLASILAEQGKMEEAAALTERLLQLSIEEGRQSDRIRLLVHKSMILSLQGRISDSMDVLEEALALAWPEGYIRTFVDEGAPLGQLLDQYIRLRQKQHRRPSHKVPLSYVKRLRRLIPQVEREAGTPHEGTVVVLTDREQSVLRLMETGMSNKEIALKLNVSLATVKTHINNIYGKLQSKNRLQALERARTLQLF